LSASSDKIPRPKLFVCVFLSSSALAQSIQQRLSPDRYQVVMPESNDAFFHWIEQERQHLDCLILQDSPTLPHLVNWLHGHATLLPTVLLEASAIEDALPKPELEAELVFVYHSAEVRLLLSKLEEVTEYIEDAISEFLNLSPSCRLPNTSSEPDLTTDLSTQNFLMLHQRRLTEKLKERLGYLGVYYKRSPKNFLRHLPPAEREELLQQLRLDYRDIILSYFTDGNTLNQKIDNFVNTAFFADIPVAEIVEAHMELMDEFAKQLKLEGRSEEVLLDYRLTLIDTIAHLCEMYRRSIPRES
jgi:circadian clock protein KaiA